MGQTGRPTEEEYKEERTVLKVSPKAIKLFPWQEKLALSTGIAAAGTCGTEPCWRASAAGFRYRDAEAKADGVRQVVLQAGAAGRSKIRVGGQGTKLVLPGLPFGQDPTVTVQLRSSAGSCWEAAYRTPARRNRIDQFKDRAE